MEKNNSTDKPGLEDASNKRRTFLKQAASLTALSAVGPLAGFATLASEQKPADSKIIGIQIGPESFVDEGTENVLDILQQKGAVNTVFLTAFTYGGGFAGRLRKGRSFPDHGEPASEEKFFHGGNYATPHAQYYRSTVLKETRAPDHGKLDIINEVLPAAKKRGMKVFCGVEDRWDKALDVPGLKECAEIDLMGNSTYDPKKRITTCVFNPNVREFWKGLVTDLSTSYNIDGILFLNERTGPLMTVLGASPFRENIGDSSQVTCFCEYHRKAAEEHHINFERTKQGYLKLHEYVQDCTKNKRPNDGYYVAFQRILLDYPEIVAYDRLFDFGKHQILNEVRAAIKGVRKSLQIVFHIEHTISFNPFIRSALSYEDLAAKADFLKPVAYNNCGGERYANFLRNLNATIYKDVPIDELMSMNNHILNYPSEAKFEDLAKAGMSSDYVYRETQRAMTGVKGKCGILTGIDINIPVNATSRQASPEDTYAATFAALKAGAQGVILSRKYSEMRLTNLAGAGRAVRDAAKI
ncbi:MAG TPA: hypothetical protein VK616_19545 [Flavitalea sp.]|nr:hypothetical protein [Flavitalea sp.]